MLMIISMKYRRNVVRKIRIVIIALALLFIGIATADTNNIDATKQISFIGKDGAEITSTDGVCLSSSSGAFCTTIESGSSFTMEVVNAKTQTNTGFVVGSSTVPVTLNHDIRVDKLGNLPSKGKVTAYIEGIVQEGKGTSASPFENIQFKERTSVSGNVTLFDKIMGWESGSRRV
jgi:hypothetical protein